MGWIVMAIITAIVGSILWSANNLAPYAADPAAAARNVYIGALVFVACLGVTCALLIRRVSRGGREANALNSGKYRKCPHCAEIIRAEAKVCKHCGREAAPAVTEWAAR
jgi:hypothetical protein